MTKLWQNYDNLEKCSKFTFKVNQFDALNDELHFWTILLEFALITAVSEIYETSYYINSKNKRALTLLYFKRRFRQ